MSVLKQFEDLQRRADSLAAEVDEQRRIAEYLRDSETRYRHLFDANPLPMWVYDLETLKFLAVNDAAIEHYGQAPVLGEMPRFSPLDADRLQAWSSSELDPRGQLLDCVRQSQRDGSNV